MTPSEPASGSLNGLVSCGRLLSLQGTGAGCMANSAEEIEELPGEEDDDALVAEEQPASETTEAKKRVCARLHADVAKICENEGIKMTTILSDFPRQLQPKILAPYEIIIFFFLYYS